MTSMYTDYTALFERAKEEEFGLALKTNNPHQMQITLCNWQREHQERDFVICIPSIPEYVFMVKKSVELT